jgi:ATP-dependent RNA helicase RhlE
MHPFGRCSTLPVPARSFSIFTADMSFEALGLLPPLVRAATDQSYVLPTAVQQACIGPVLQGRDVLATAQTGSGKTAAYALPLLQVWLQAAQSGRAHGGILVVVPTRELAMQVGDVMNGLSRRLPMAPKTVVVFGGVSINPQMMALRGGADVVVATPGRLLDLVDHGAMGLRGVGALVLDEADRLLDLGFAEEMKRVISMLPAQRQSLFFSATFAPDVQTLAHALLNDPVRVDIPVEPDTRPDIQQRAIRVDTAARTPLLRHLIAQEGWTQVMVFVATQYDTERVAEKLNRHGIEAAAFHGQLSQGRRTEVLAAFKQQRLRVLVATDVAARGIDVAQLPAVVNYDLPRSADDHVHRIGRTGRAGMAGVAVSLVTVAAEGHFRLIENRQGFRVKREVLPGFEPVEAPPETAAGERGPDNGGIKGRRKSKKDKLREAASRQDS